MDLNPTTPFSYGERLLFKIGLISLSYRLRRNRVIRRRTFESFSIAWIGTQYSSFLVTRACIFLNESFLYLNNSYFYPNDTLGELSCHSEEMIDLYKWMRDFNLNIEDKIPNEMSVLDYVGEFKKIWSSESCFTKIL